MAPTKISKVRKGTQRAKKPAKLGRAQRIKDEESKIVLDRSTIEQQRQIRDQVDNSSSQRRRPSPPKPEGWDVLRSMNDLAKESVASKLSDPTRGASSSRSNQSNALLASLLDGFDNINVSQGKKTNSSNNSIKKNDRPPAVSSENQGSLDIDI